MRIVVSFLLGGILWEFLRKSHEMYEKEERNRQKRKTQEELKKELKIHTNSS